MQSSLLRISVAIYDFLFRVYTPARTYPSRGIGEYLKTTVELTFEQIAAIEAADARAVRELTNA